MKNQALFSSKDKSKKFKCRLLQFLFGALRVKLQVHGCILRSNLNALHSDAHWCNVLEFKRSVKHIKVMQF